MNVTWYATVKTTFFIFKLFVLIIFSMNGRKIGLKYRCSLMKLIFQSLTWRMSVCLRERIGVRLQLLPRKLLSPATMHPEVLHPSRLPHNTHPKVLYLCRFPHSMHLKVLYLCRFPHSTILFTVSSWSHWLPCKTLCFFL